MPRKQNKYYDHDNRTGGNPNIRKVSFKHGSARIRKNQRPDHLVVRYVADDDIEMGGVVRQPWKGGKPRKSFRARPGSPGVRYSNVDKLLKSENNWFQIRIPFGAKYEKTYILQLLLKHLSPKVFIPISYSVIDRNVIFYVDDYDIALSLQNANNKIRYHDGFMMKIKVKERFPPPIVIDDKVKEQLKLVMAKRYIAENRALDLSKFSSDPDFQNNIYCPLGRPSVMKAVWQIISENISDLVALNLTDNKISLMDISSSVEIRKLKNLKILHLGGNRIKSIHVLNCFKDLELTELVLKGNPIVNMYKDNAHYVSPDSVLLQLKNVDANMGPKSKCLKATVHYCAKWSKHKRAAALAYAKSLYIQDQISITGNFILYAGVFRITSADENWMLLRVAKSVSEEAGPDEWIHIPLVIFHSEIRKKFPKLTKLDEIELPPVISFDVADEAKLPTPQAAFICNPEGRGIVKAFLSQYFALYDSDNRLDLAQAYHDNSSFSICVYYPPNEKSTTHKLINYMKENRNLFKVQDYPRRKSRLRTGKQEIVQFLNQLPKTQHDLSSFVVDLTLFTPALLNLTVNGVFREPDFSKTANFWPIRHFSRTFLIVPVNQGFCIINEMLSVTNATESEIQCSFKEETQNATILQSPSSVNQPSSDVSAVASAIQSIQLDESVRLQMIQTLATRTGMNLEWSKKCLDETQWDFDRAIWTFTELQSKGTIPAEAFIK